MNKEKVIELNKYLKNKFNSINLWTTKLDKNFKIGLEKFIDSLGFLSEKGFSKMEREVIENLVRDLKVKASEWKLDKVNFEDVQGSAQNLISKLNAFGYVGTASDIKKNLFILLKIPTRTELDFLNQKVVRLEQKIKNIVKAKKVA